MVSYDLLVLVAEWVATKTHITGLTNPLFAIPDKWVSTLHRVIAPPHDGQDHRRQSIAFFVNVNGNADVETLATCVDKEHPVKYKPVTAGQYVLHKYLKSMGDDRDEL
jgi:isopenicillin N synthase-like dioxygenase